MFDFFKKLLMSRQMSFERGQIKIGNDTAIMVSGAAFSNITDSLLKDMKEAGMKQIYLASKEGGKALGRSFQKMYDISGVKLANLLKNLAEMGGWGEFEFTRIDPKEKAILCVVINSPFAKLSSIRGKKVCHMTRGLLAGAASVGFHTDAGCIETACAAEGGQACTFIVKPAAKFDKKNKTVKEQLYWLV